MLRRSALICVLLLGLASQGWAKGKPGGGGDDTGGDDTGDGGKGGGGTQSNVCYVPLSGNGYPKGALKEFQMNIIGVPKDKKSDNTNNGRRIFVPLDGKVKIELSEGPFKILDHDATQGTAAFQLPSPCDGCDGTGIIELSYSVFARPLGKPGGAACMTTCAEYDGAELCSAKSYFAQRVWGKSTAVNVADTLLGMYVYDCANERWEFKELFDSDMENYYWEYDNAGLKLLQLRFYACSTNTVDPNGDLCPPGSEFWCVDNKDLVDTTCADEDGYIGVDPNVDKCGLNSAPLEEESSFSAGAITAAVGGGVAGVGMLAGAVWAGSKFAARGGDAAGASV